MKKSTLLLAGLCALSSPAFAAPIISDFVVFGSTSVTTGSNVGAVAVPVSAAVGSNGTVSIGGGGNYGDGDDAIILTGGGGYTGGSNAKTVGDIIFSGNVSIGGGSTVQGSVHSGGNVTTGSNATVTQNIVATGNVTIGGGNAIGGSVLSGGNISTGSNASITGTAQASGTVSLGGSSTAGAIVTGAPAPTPLAYVPVAMPTASIFSAGGADATVGGGGALTLGAGIYGDLTTGSNADVNLSSGTYFFDSFKLGGGTDLTLDLSLGGILINIVGDLDFGSNVNVILVGGDASDVLFELHGEATVGGGTKWFGTLFAPDSEVSFGSNARITGAVYGDIVGIGGGSWLTHVQSDALFPTAGGGGQEVPEPAALASLGFGLIALGLFRRRRMG